MSVDAAHSRDRVASLAMYVDPPVVREATRRLWMHVCDTLRADGLKDVPDRLDETSAYDAAWTDPRLLLAQTCGYPYARRLRGQVRLIATPCYDHPGCAGASGGSFVVVRADDRATSIPDLRGRRAAFNDRNSNSGYNLLRSTVAPHARDGRFFAGLVETGGHTASLTAIVEATADVAAIDCVTWGNWCRHAPHRLERLRILAETAKTPALPLITRAGATDAEVVLLRKALDGAMTDPKLATMRRTLGLRDFAILTDADYDAVLDLERDAICRGYPVLA